MILIYKFISKGENPHEKSLRSIIVDLICFSSLHTKTMEMYASSAFYKLFGHQIPYLWKVLYMCVFTFTFLCLLKRGVLDLKTVTEVI